MAGTQYGLFTDLDEDTVLQIRAKAIEMVLAGKTLLQWSGEGTEARKAFTLPVDQVLSECRYALRMINPSVYGNLTTMVKPFFV